MWPVLVCVNSTEHVITIIPAGGKNSFWEKQNWALAAMKGKQETPENCQSAEGGYPREAPVRQTVF